MHLFNNCRNRSHAVMYGPGAFYDLDTTGHQATLANNLPADEQCIVASVAADGRIDFDWYRFKRERIRPDTTGKDCRVFFGDPIRSETRSRHAAMRDGLYSKFFDSLGRFKQRSVLHP
jgi:hypothetical protein